MCLFSVFSCMFFILNPCFALYIRIMHIVHRVNEMNKINENKDKKSNSMSPLENLASIILDDDRTDERFLKAGYALGQSIHNKQFLKYYTAKVMEPFQKLEKIVKIMQAMELVDLMDMTDDSSLDYY